MVLIATYMELRDVPPAETQPPSPRCLIGPDPFLINMRPRWNWHRRLHGAVVVALALMLLCSVMLSNDAFIHRAASTAIGKPEHGLLAKATKSTASQWSGPCAAHPRETIRCGVGTDSSSTDTLELAHIAWQEDRHTDAIRLYLSALEAAGAGGEDPGRLPIMDHLQCHANLGSSYMALAEDLVSLPGVPSLPNREALLAASMQHWQVAAKVGPSSPLLDYFLTAVGRDLGLAMAANRASKEMNVADMVSDGSPQVRPMDRRAASDLTYAEFLERYVSKRVPVVITGMAPGAPQWQWDFNLLEERCGDFLIERKQHRPENAGKEWGALGEVDDGSRMPLREHFKELRTLARPSAMLFDQALSDLCPDLLDDFVVPKYFAVDYLRAIPFAERAGLQPKPSQIPGIYVQPAGSRCGLHTDQGGTHFYQLLLAGRKRWRVFSVADMPKLYPRRQGMLFEADAFAPDPSRFPLMGAATAFEVVLGPGEGIYVPPNSPHQVLTEEVSIAVSANYISGIGFDSTLAQLTLLSQGGAQPAYSSALEALKKWSPPPGSTQEDPGDLTWKDFDRAAWML